jgi:isoaspartyl peptidase/L-asparaginase-like protein (Ntn-hydrolase superfamily)
MIRTTVSDEQGTRSRSSTPEGTERGRRGREDHAKDGGAQALRHGRRGGDSEGRLAAGTSTGGMTDKRYGRVGDSPIVGAGSYADVSCAVSSTGWGEYYIRVSAAVRYACAWQR